MWDGGISTPGGPSREKSQWCKWCWVGGCRDAGNAGHRGGGREGASRSWDAEKVGKEVAGKCELQYESARLALRMGGPGVVLVQQLRGQWIAPQVTISGSRDGAPRVGF